MLTGAVQSIEAISDRTDGWRVTGWQVSSSSFRPSSRGHEEKTEYLGKPGVYQMNGWLSS
jgi:hypothetical protein